MKKIINNNVEVTGYCWITGRDGIGVVLAIDTISNESKAYIGTYDNRDEYESILHILSWGTKFDVDIAKQLIDKYGTKI